MLSLSEASLDTMRALRDDIKESVFRSLVGNKGTVIEQVSSTLPVKLIVELGKI